MANTVSKYFDSDKNEYKFIFPIEIKKFKEMFPGQKFIRSDSFSCWVSSVDNKIVPIARIINYKKQPSKHKCDGRCLHAKGNTCECSCGGANHGAGG